MTTSIETEIFMSANRTGVCALIAAALMLFLPCVGHADPEIGGDPDPSPMTSPFQLDDLDTRINISLARLIMTDEDLGEQYDGMWMLGGEVSFAMAPLSRFFLSGHFGSMKGDPYVDDPTFTGGDTRFRALPLRAGLRLDSSANSAFKMEWTAAYQIAWVSEETPIYDYSGATSIEEPSGWTTGLFFGVAPSVIWAEGTRTVRLEMGWTGFGGDIGHGVQRHEISASGIWLALGTTIQL